MKRTGLIIILTLALDLAAFTQTNIDSLETILPLKSGSEKIDILNDLAKAHWGRDPEKTFEYGELALKLSIDSGYKKGEATAFKNVGIGYQILGDHSRAFEYMRKSYKIYEEINDSTGMANSLNNIGVINDELSDYETALEYYFKSQKIYEAIGDTGGIAASLINIGNIHDVLKNKDKALSNYQEALKLCEKTGDNEGAAICLNNMGIIYSDLKDFAKAIEYYQKALIIYEEIGDLSGVSTALLNLGDAYDELERQETALEYYQRSLEINEKLGDKLMHSTILNNLGDLYRKMKNYDKSHEYLEMSLKIAQELKVKDMMKENYDCLAKLYEDKGNYKTALENYKLFAEIKDSIFTDESSHLIAEMQTKYDTEKKNKENELLRKEKEIHQATIKRQYTITIAIGVGLLLVIIMVIIMIRANNNKKKANQLLREQKLRIENQANELKQVNEKLIELDHFKEGMTGMIVHDLKNPLSAVINYSEGKEDHSQIVIHQAGKQMLNMVMNILDVQKFEDAQMHLETEENNLYEIARTAAGQVEFLSREKGVDIVNKIPRDLNVDVDSGIIERVFINLLTNAIKYTPTNGKAILETAGDPEGMIRVSVTDTGEGISQDHLGMVFEKFQQVQPRKSSSVRSTGLGLTFCRLAIESHGGKIGVESETGKGAKFWFTLKKSAKTTAATETDSVAVTAELTLSESDIENLRPIIEQFEKLEIYEISDLKKVLKQVRPDADPGVKLWKDEMLRAVYAVNEEKYHQLMKIHTG